MHTKTALALLIYLWFFDLRNSCRKKCDYSVSSRGQCIPADTYRCMMMTPVG